MASIVRDRPCRLRTASNGNTAARTTTTADKFTFDGKTFDFKLQLKVGKQTVQLTLMEAELLRYLIRSTGKPVSRKAILQNVWNLHEDTDTRAIDNFIVRLRRYIEREPTKPRHLVTVRGLGYQFVLDPQNNLNAPRKSRVGLDSTGSPREFSFCAHAMEHPQPFIVRNTEKDPRFSQNPLVTGKRARRVVENLRNRRVG